MVRSKKRQGAQGQHFETLSDSISELSHDSSTSNISRSGLRGRLSRLVHHSHDGTDRAPPRQQDARPRTQVKSTGTGHAAKSPSIDKKKLLKDAKSRFNIGLVYLKTEDYAKAQENLENSLFCHIKAAGHDTKAYSNDTILAIAGVREKLGDCFLANPAIVDKNRARDHYEESQRLLKRVDPEDASDKITEMLQRVEERLKQPGLPDTGARRKPPSFLLKKEGNVKLGSGGATVETAEASHLPPPPKNKKKKTAFCKIAGSVVDAGLNLFDDSSDEETSPRSTRSSDPEWRETAMAHLERENHRTALNYLRSLRKGGSMTKDKFRREMADSMLKVAASAFEAGKVGVATDAYEEAHAVLKRDEDAGENKKLAVKGCIKGNKLLAKEMEGVQNYGSAISHRTKVYQLLDEENRTVPACRQKLRIAYLHGEEEEYAKSTLALSESIGRLHQGIKSVDQMASDRRDLLVQSYQMQAICYAKLNKWNEALEQYAEVLPLVAKREGKDGRSGKQYNSMVIHKSVLLVTVGNHRLAASTIDEYLKNAKVSQPMAGTMIVDFLDHALALDIYAMTQLKLGKVDRAISIFQEKLAFVKTLADEDGLKSDTMHKLGCLLANQNQPQTALPLLNESLRTKKMVYGGRHRSVLGTTWAVAATHHTLGDNNKALEEYTALLDKMTNVDGMPVDAVAIHHSVGKLFVEEGKVDQAIQSFRQALRSSGDPKPKSEITLNLANALSTAGEAEEAMELYDEILNDKSLKKTKLAFLARFNRSLLLVQMGDVEEAKGILRKIAANVSPMADVVRGKVYLMLGNLAVSDGNIDEALGYFEDSLNMAEDGDLSAIVHTKRCVSEAQLRAGQIDEAISTLEHLLEDLSDSGVEGKSANLLQAKIWNSLALVYKEQDDVHRAKHFAKLALRTYKTELGETNPITLRNVSNLQLLLLEEAEDLEQSEAKSIIDAAKYELEEVLGTFVSMNDPSYRLDVASLKINLGLVAVWQEKPKKAKKLVQQVQEIELPPGHSLVHRIALLEECVEELEKKSTTGAAVEQTPKRSKRNNSTEETQRPPKKSKKRKGKKQK